MLEAPLSGRQRFAVLLQAAALLSHLSAVGWRLISEWSELEIDESCVVRGAATGAGRDTEPPQQKLVELLLSLFRSQGRVAGKGSVRRAASRLAERWQGGSGPLRPDRAVGQILEVAPFLWRRTFAPARGSLVSEYESAVSRHLRVAGSGGFDMRLLRAAGDLQGLKNLVESNRAEEFWIGPRSPGTPRQLLAMKRWRSAAVAWESSRPVTARDKLEAARAFHGAGRFREAEQSLSGQQTTESRLLLADCCLRRGSVTTARRHVETLARRRLSPSDLLRVGQLAVAIYGELDLTDQASRWAERALHRVRGGLRPRAHLLAAEVAWANRQLSRLGQCLDSSSGLCTDPRHGWRWFRLAAFAARERGALPEAEQAVASALRLSRRRLCLQEAAELWRMLARIRLERGCFDRAEKAARQAMLLLDGSEDRQWHAAVRDLIEIRIRRGSFHCVDSSLEALDDVPGVATAALRARLELARGRPAEALTRLQQELAGSNLPAGSELRSILQLLSARALGWLGRGAECHRLLQGLPPTAWRALEAEESSAVWALAGDRVRASDAAGRQGLAALWSPILRGERVFARDWEPLTEVDPYRAARFIFDVELVAPARAPKARVRRASEDLRRVGADSLAERLDRRRRGPWSALETYLKPKRSDKGSALADLFSAAGYFDVRMSWRNGSREEVLVPGKGGGRELSNQTRGGLLVLEADRLDPALRALFAMAVRDFRPVPSSPVVTSKSRGIVGDSPRLLEALSRLARLSVTDMALLIQGETGTGKELAARQVHRLSSRSSQSFVAVNCAALADSLLLSDLFGHVRGAFTGADRDRAGIFEAAVGGTVFLDEIGDLPQDAQGKLLRVLQEGEVRRLGESLPRRVDARVVTATHRDLGAMVAEGTFRSDLFYRLRVGSVHLPPLRERDGDVILLADHFLAREGYELTARAQQRLTAYTWPGNVRELQSVLQVAMALTETGTVDAEQLELPQERARARLGYHQRVADFRRDLVRQALADSDGNRAEAARRLDLSRQALSYLVRRLGVS